MNIDSGEQRMKYLFPLLISLCLYSSSLGAQAPETNSSGLHRWATQLEARGIRVTAGIWDIKTGTFIEGHQES